MSNYHRCEYCGGIHCWDWEDAFTDDDSGVGDGRVIAEAVTAFLRGPATRSGRTEDSFITRSSCPSGRPTGRWSRTPTPVGGWATATRETSCRRSWSNSWTGNSRPRSDNGAFSRPEGRARQSSGPSST